MTGWAPTLLTYLVLVTLVLAILEPLATRAIQPTIRSSYRIFMAGFLVVSALELMHVYVAHSL